MSSLNSHASLIPSTHNIAPTSPFRTPMPSSPPLESSIPSTSSKTLRSNLLEPNLTSRDPDLYASSVSSADSPPPTLPPRPDSPRPNRNDAFAASRARLNQLAVWSDAAVDEREEDDNSMPSLIRRDRIDQSKDRVVPKEGIIRRKSLFCGRGRVGFDRGSIVGFDFGGWRTNTSNKNNNAPMERRMSIRRGKSFHRYARIGGKFGGDRKINDEFDDLTEGLQATKVTETQIVRGF